MQRNRAEDIKALAIRINKLRNFIDNAYHAQNRLEFSDWLIKFPAAEEILTEFSKNLEKQFQHKNLKEFIELINKNNDNKLYQFLRKHENISQWLEKNLTKIENINKQWNYYRSQFINWPSLFVSLDTAFSEPHRNETKTKRSSQEKTSSKSQQENTIGDITLDIYSNLYDKTWPEHADIDKKRLAATEYAIELVTTGDFQKEQIKELINKLNEYQDAIGRSIFSDKAITISSEIDNYIKQLEQFAPKKAHKETPSKTVKQKF